MDVGRKKSDLENDEACQPDEHGSGKPLGVLTVKKIASNTNY